MEVWAIKSLCNFYLLLIFLPQSEAISSTLNKFLLPLTSHGRQSWISCPSLRTQVFYLLEGKADVYTPVVCVSLKENVLDSSGHKLYIISYQTHLFVRHSIFLCTTNKAKILPAKLQHNTIILRLRSHSH